MLTICAGACSPVAWIAPRSSNKGNGEQRQACARVHRATRTPGGHATRSWIAGLWPYSMVLVMVLLHGLPGQGLPRSNAGGKRGTGIKQHVNPTRTVNFLNVLMLRLHCVVSAMLTMVRWCLQITPQQVPTTRFLRGKRHNCHSYNCHSARNLQARQFPPLATSCFLPPCI
jgi:hypothetical protein